MVKEFNFIDACQLELTQFILLVQKSSTSVELDIKVHQTDNHQNQWSKFRVYHHYPFQSLSTQSTYQTHSIHNKNTQRKLKIEMGTH